MSTGPQDSSMEPLRLQRRGEHVPYQIFPDPAEQLEPAQVKSGAARLKERLPSIVVEPSEESEEDSGGPHWPRSQASIEEEEEVEDAFQDHCDPNSSGQEEQRDVDGAPHFKRSSIPSIQIDYSRLTPPPSPTSSHAAPPCLRS